MPNLYKVTLELTLEARDAPAALTEASYMIVSDIETGDVYDPDQVTRRIELDIDDEIETIQAAPPVPTDIPRIH